MIGNGAVMGFTPLQVREMSLWEYSAVCAGYSGAQGGKPKTKAPSIEEHRARVAASMARDEQAAAERRLKNDE